MIGVALLGYGWWGQHIARRLKDHPEFDLRCVVEPATALHADIEGLGLIVAQNYEAALADPAVHAVILTSPNDLHDSQIAQAVAAGKHVFCEKATVTVRGAVRAPVLQPAAKMGSCLGIGHERRFEPAVLALRKMLARR